MAGNRDKTEQTTVVVTGMGIVTSLGVGKDENWTKMAAGESEFGDTSTLADPSPMTHRTASIILDLPQPLGPTMPVRLVGAKKVVASTKDLNPASLIAVSLIQASLVGTACGRRYPGRRPGLALECCS